MTKRTKKEIDAAAAAVKKVEKPLSAAIQTILEAAPVGNVIACYDNGFTKDETETLCAEAAKYIVKGIVGAMCYNLHNGYRTFGQNALNRALDEVDAAAERAEQFRTQKADEQFNSKCLWAARMDVQQTYRKELLEFFEALHALMTGERYQRPVAKSDKSETPQTDAMARIRERRAELNGTDNG